LELTYTRDGTFEVIPWAEFHPSELFPPTEDACEFADGRIIDGKGLEYISRDEWLAQWRAWDEQREKNDARMAAHAERVRRYDEETARLIGIDAADLMARYGMNETDAAHVRALYGRVAPHGTPRPWWPLTPLAA
jgi:hypothetical protein